MVKKMKKFLIVLATLIILCGCASNKEVVERGNPVIETDDPEPVSLDVTIKTEEEVQKSVKGANDDKLLSRTNNANIGNVILKEFNENEVIARSGIEKGNNDFNEFMDFVYESLYSEVPSSANYPAVKYIIGEWTFAIVASEEMLGVDFAEIGYAELDLDLETGELSLVLHPRILNYENELYSETDEEAGYLPFYGYRQDDNTFLLDDNDGLLVSIRHYYEIEGHEFVRARMFVSEDSYADVLLFRVQE